MNKTYRTVWNATTGTWAAAPETARMRTKSKSSSAMKSSVSAAVAVMAGVGGGAMSVDAMAQAANGGGSLSLCAPGTGATGTTFGGGNTVGTRTTAACGTAIPNFRLSEGHERSFQLYNNSNVNGSGIGQASAATEAGISGTVDGHLFLLGGSGVHLRGPVDFDSNASMTNHRITNLAAGSAGTDAVNVNQLNAAVAASNNPYVAISTGAYASATPAVATAANSATAVGGNARATGISAVALGGNTVASNQNATAIGTLSQATGSESVAVGTSARATGANSSAFGQGTVAQAAGATAIGSGANSGTANSIAMGRNAVVNAGGVTGANSSIAIGNGAVAGGTDTIVIGTSASHSGSGATVVGANASAAGGGAGVAVGNRSSASGNAAVALGQSSTASGQNSVALGTGSTASAANTVSVGSGMVQRRITNMAAGTAATDAVNVSQLTGVTNALGGGAGVGANGTVTQPTYTVAGRNYNNVGDALDAIAANGGDPDSVKYDDATHRAVTLGNAGTPVAIRNVAAGALSATSTDAVNGSQLFATNTRVGDLEDSLKDGGVIDPITGESLAVVYDGTTKDKVTLQGADGTTLSNVKAGVADMDAVNVSQLKDSGLIGDDGKSIAAVTYDRNADGTPNYGTVTLGNGAGPTQIKNVADATDDHDALNLGQLKGTGLVGDDGSGNLTSLAVTYDSAAKDTVTLAGADGTTLSNVKAGVADMDAVNVSQLKDSGLIGDDGKSIAAVTYDRNADGTPNYGTVTLGNGVGPTQLKNVADATDDHDALNLGQLKGTGLVGDDGSGNLTSLAVTYDSATKDKVTLAGGADGTTLSNVKAGVADMDAVNVSQLKDSGLIGDDGKSIAAVTYDDATKTSVTLGNAGTPVGIHNVADGVLSATSKDAVNGSQLFATNTRVGDLEDSLKDGGVIDPITGESLAVVYDGTTKDKVTLAGGADGTTLSNVKAGVADMDAVNVSQLKDSGLIGDDGKSIAAVTYDRNADGTPNYGTVTLGNGAGPTQIKNVAAGVDGTDAVNLNQMNTGLSDLEDRLKGADLRFVKVNADPVTGTPALATGALAVAIGSGAQAAGANSLALGSGARVSGAGSVAIGYNSVANQNNVVSVGSVGNERRIVNVADGDVSFQSTDAVNGGQLYAALNDLSTSVSSKTQQAIDSFSSAIDEKTKAAIDEMNAQSIKPMDVTDPLVAIEGVRGDNLASLNGADPSTATAAAIGSSTVASGANAVAVGLQSGALSDNSVAIGSFAQTGAGQPYSVAMGSNVQTNGTQAVAMGANAQANADYATAIGNNDVQAIGTGSVAVGSGANVRAGATNSIAMGTGANVARNVQGAMALGSGATATTNGGIALGDNALANRANALSIGRAGAERQIINVAAGTQNTDAVNVGQLKGVTNALGGGAGVGADGSVTQPTYSVGGKDYNNVGDALGAIAASGGDPDAVKYDDGTHQAITLGNAGTPVAIHNVAEGALTATSTDAVNGAQLFATNQSIGDLRDSLKDGGVIDPVTGESLAVVYDGTAKDKVTLKGADGTTLANVKAGVADMDAVNVSQLKDSGLIGDDGKAIAAVTYDDATKGAVTLGGAGATTPVALKNVADAKDDHDALNLGQLKDAGLVGDDGSGNLTSMAVTYDGAARDKVTLQGADGTTLANVKAGVADMDAVNVSQLKGSGLIGDDGKSIAAVTYDRLADGTPNYGSVTFGHGAGPTQLKNVAAATDNTDAVNFGQMKDYVGDHLGDPGLPGNPLAVAYDDATKGQVTLAGGADGTTITNVKAGEVSATSTDAINGAQLHGTAQSVADALGGGSTVSADGKVTNPTYSLADPTDGSTKTDYHNVGDALANLDGRTSTNTENITVINKQLGDSGLVDPVTGQSIAAVTYDRNADGTPNLGSVTLGGADATTPVALKNVADGTDRHDAINLGQLQDAGLVAPVDPSNPGAGLKSLAVTYDGVDQDKATLKGADGTTLSNVKAGVADMDAVNVSQLKGSGLIGDDGKAIAAVTYDRNADGTPNYGQVTLGHGEGPTQLKNVANATDDGDALNLGQLKEAGLVGDDGSGNLTSLAVTYDNAAKDAITLGNAGTPVAIHNVADGVLSATSKDAVNGSQLYATNTRVGDIENSLKDGGVIDPVTGKSLAVVYDGAAKDTVTMAGAAGTTIANVKAGVADMDAVNVSQLKGSGLIGDDGKAIAAVTYDRNADGTPNLGSVTLGGAGATPPVALKNVADGVDRHDAINLGQLQDAGLVAPADPTNPGAGLTSTAVTYDKHADGSVNFDQITLKGGADGTKLSNVAAGEVSATSKDAINGAQLHGTAQSVSDSLGGGSTVGADGTVTNPTYSLADPTDGSTKTEYHNVGDALANLDGRTSTNTENITVINKQLGDSGLVDPVTGQTLAAVTYDRNADGTPNRGSVTLGGADATTPVALKNVADGVDANDAVNVGQLQAAGIVAPVDPENPGKGLKSLAVTYDGVDQDKVTLKGADGTTLTNVKAGAVTATSTDAINGSQLHATAQSVADSLGGGSTVGADGKVTSPTYSLADPTDGSTKTEYHNVGDALANLDGRTSTNTENITVINKQLADTGLVDPVTGQSLAAVTYDRNADGTPNRGSVTLGGADATAPVALKNVADGTDRHDAINLGQLQDAGLVAPVDPTNPATGLTSLAVTYDKHADGSANFDQISLKGENGTTITNVKAGAVSATSTDAVNGSQLYGASQSVAKALGGGATVDANGNVTNPTYTVNNEKFDNVGDALDNISSSLVHGSIGLVQQDETTRDITVAKDTDGTTVNFAGTAGDRVLTGVGAGVVSATSNDAINGSQLHGTAQSVADTIGGGTTVDADGKLADTSIEVNGSKYKTVAEAVQAAAAYGATDSLAVRYDLNGDGTPNYGSVTLGGTGAAPVRLTNVANGTTQYDAVNFGQLSELSDRIGGVDDRVGRLEQNPGGGGGGGGGSGGSDYFAGTDVGTGTTPANAGNGVGNTAAGSGAVVGTGVNNGTVVGSNANVSASNGTAIGSGSKSSAEGATAIGNNANASGSKSAAIGDGASASGSNSVALGAGSMATSDNTVSVGSATQQRTISNLADGVNASDAATKGQMDRAIGGVQGQVNELSRNAYSGIAAATALTMIPGVDPGKTLSFGIGGATFQGYQAVAFGGEARITQNLKMKAGVGLSSGGNTVGVGASYQW
ncbi:YadA-like family protein [Burkholderia contaminans]|uniref:YadA-like family protein n=1 Tax=Burkholderia contaminans TaxID=488447 RepID=UPI001FC7F0D3|nr:YadA-like family protein [Burkholderia contaminans]